MSDLRMKSELRRKRMTERMYMIYGAEIWAESSLTKTCIVTNALIEPMAHSSGMMLSNGMLLNVATLKLKSIDQS